MKALRTLFLIFLLGGLLTACSGSQSEVSTNSYILTTGFEGGELVYLGVGGEINGILNPTLHAYPGETITVMLINGGEGKHNFSVPAVNAKSASVTKKGQKSILTFTVPEQEIDLEYYDSLSNHAEIGMAGIIRVSKDTGASSQIGIPQAGQVEAVSGDTSLGAQIFQEKCASCHTIGGGRLVGPDLEGVANRRELDWLERFIIAPEDMIAAEDPIAVALLEEYNNLVMPNPLLTNEELGALMSYLVPQEEEVEQPGEEGQTTSPDENQVVQAANGDAAYGEYLFVGSVAFRNGGVPCMSSHSVEGVGAIGGGTLGPDLTEVYSRYGEAGLAAALSGMPFPTMQEIFKNKQLSEKELADLLTFFKEVDQNGKPQTQQNTFLFLAVGSGLTIIFFGVMLYFWPSQRMSLSERLRKFGKL